MQIQEIQMKIVQYLHNLVRMAKLFAVVEAGSLILFWQLWRQLAQEEQQPVCARRAAPECRRRASAYAQTLPLRCGNACVIAEESERRICERS